MSNTAVGVHPEATYVRVDDPAGGRPLILSADLVESVLGSGDDGPAPTPTAAWTGAELVGATYQRPLELVDIPDAHRVLGADFVTTHDGTGLVHLAPAFGADDMAAVRTAGFPIVNPVQADGHFEPDVALVGGMWFREANQPIIDDLVARGVLYRELAYEHAYPHCWRCHSALLYYALPAWYIRTTEIADRLLEENERTNWVPETMKWGRYGDWLRGNVDWSLSRSRYWGTPLPIWICPDDHETAVSSIADLAEKAGRDLADLDPHRPFVDAVTITCGHDGCGQEATRVSEVIDVWYDSGAMPFAQFGYPHAAGSTATFDDAYPAQYICEAVDQTRGWFYSLMAIGTLVFDRSSYENVVVLGHILAEDGRKMSKHLGNVIAPMPLLDQHGADAVRWFMLCSGSPWNARRVGHGNMEEVVRKVVLGLWNTAAFFTLYAEVSGWDPATASVPTAGERDALDRWVSSRLATLVAAVTDALDAFDTAAAGKHLVAFLDDLSNWYVRRSRRRFWAGDAAALSTLHEVLHTVSRLMAPFTPFVSEEVWRSIRLDGDADSVHLADWPVADAASVDPELEEQVDLVRRLVELGRSARASQKVKTRQPLARALVGGPGWEQLPQDLRDAVASELNVQTVDGLGSSLTLVDISAKPNFRTLGAKHGKAVQAIAAAIRDADAAELATALADGTAAVEVDGAVDHPRRRGRGRQRVAPRGLGRGVGRRRDHRARPHPHPRADRARARPRGRAPGAGRPQAVRLRRVGPHRAVVDRRRRAGDLDRRAPRLDRGRGAGRLVRGGPRARRPRAGGRRRRAQRLVASRRAGVTRGDRASRVGTSSVAASSASVGFPNRKPWARRSRRTAGGPTAQASRRPRPAASGRACARSGRWPRPAASRANRSCRSRTSGRS